MIALKGQWPMLPDVRLYHDPDKAARRVGKVEPRHDPGARTWVTDGEAVVLMSYRGDRITEDALLVHEAYHIVCRHYRDYLMEETPGEEVMAYAVQAVGKALMEAQERWRGRHE